MLINYVRKHLTYKWTPERQQHRPFHLAPGLVMPRHCGGLLCEAVALYHTIKPYVTLSCFSVTEVLL